MHYDGHKKRGKINEFNRCSLPRLKSGNHKDILKELRDEEEDEKAVTIEIKNLQKQKREKMEKKRKTQH